MQISIIAAVARNGVIGSQGKLPWHLPSDLKRFCALTIGKTVIMGRKTWDGLPKIPLRGRWNIVVTQSHSHHVPNTATACPSFDSALGRVKRAREGEVCIIGGGEIYRQALPLADRILLTRVNLEPEGDVTFPEITGFRSALIGDWQVENGIQFRYETHTRHQA